MISPQKDKIQSKSFFAKQFNKICLDGAGKGRIELVGSKYVFGYESVLNKAKNLFDLALDFPVVGETKVSLSLNPKEVSKQIYKSEIVDMLREQLPERSDREQVVRTVGEFFVFSSDFIRYRALGVLPTHFSMTMADDHFILERETPNYKYLVDSFSDNQSYFERTQFKIFLKSTSMTEPVMTLFLVPQSCER